MPDSLEETRAKRERSLALTVAIIALVAAVAAAVIPLGWQAYSGWTMEHRSISLVDVLAYDGSNHEVIDFKVTNPSSATAFLKRLAILIDSTRVEGAFCCLKESSHDYSLDLTDTHEIPISQAMPPGSADRFTVTLVARGDPGAAMAYRIQPVLYYGEADSVRGPRFWIYLRGITSGARKQSPIEKGHSRPPRSRFWRDVRKYPDTDALSALWGR